MKIRLKGDLDENLTNMGFKPGDELTASISPLSSTGQANFSITFKFTKECCVAPENYDIVDN